MAKTGSATFSDFEITKTPALNQWQADFNRALSDFGRFWSNGSTANIDMSWLLSYQRKNIAAITAAGQRAFEGAQAIAKLQADFARETAEELSKVTKELITYGSVEDKFAKQAGAAKEAFETVAANVNELAKLVQQSRTATFEVIHERVIESFDEVQAAFEPKPTKRAA